jgi:hypothetical protein
VWSRLRLVPEHCPPVGRSLAVDPAIIRASRLHFGFHAPGVVRPTSASAHPWRQIEKGCDEKSGRAERVDV